VRRLPSSLPFKFMAACVVLGCSLLAPDTSVAGLFGISPIRIDLDRQNKTDSITVSNDEADRSLDMQTKLYAWTQNEKGEDIYTESNDLVFFPRIFSVEKEDKRVVRVGLKVPGGATEKAYRLFVEELPPKPDPERKGAQIVFVLRFGIAVFVRPDKEQLAGNIEAVEGGPGNAAIVIHNTGNANFQIQSLALRSENGYEKEVAGGYVLSGATRRFNAAFPADICAKTGKLQILMKTDRIGTIERSFDWTAARCGTK
jgi:fimbrial chaperone protein